MGFDYNYFTKSELVSFLNKHSDDFKYINKPFEIMLGEKIEKAFKELEEMQGENDLLIKQLDIQESDKLNVSIQLMENHKKWKKLHEQIDKFSKVAYGE